MVRPLVGWLLWVGPLQGGYAYGGVSPGWLPSHTKCAVATAPVVGKDSQSGQKWLIFEDCKGTENRKLACISPKMSKLDNQVHLSKKEEII